MKQKRTFKLFGMALAVLVLASAGGSNAESLKRHRSERKVRRRARIARVLTVADASTNIAILEGGSRGFVSLNNFEAQAMPFTKEVSDGAGMHSSASPTCAVVPADGTYRILGSVQFSLDEFGERILRLTARAPGASARNISFPVTAAPSQSFVTFLSVSSVTTLRAGDCVELVAEAPGHGSPNGLFALAVGFALWQN